MAKPPHFNESAIAFSLIGAILEAFFGVDEAKGLWRSRGAKMFLYGGITRRLIRGSAVDAPADVCVKYTFMI